MLPHKVCSFIILYIVVCFSNLGTAQEQIDNIRDLELPDGYHSNRIQYFLQDLNGIIWIVTSKSTISYDGTRVRNFTKSNTISKSAIEGLFEDNLGNIFLLSGEYDSTLDKSISVYNKEKGKFELINQYLKEPYDISTAYLVTGGLFNGVNILISSDSNFSRYQLSELKDKTISNLFPFNLDARPTHRPTYGWKHSDDNYAVLAVPKFADNLGSNECYLLNYSSSGELKGEYRVSCSFPLLIGKYLCSDLDYSKFISEHKDIESFAQNISSLLMSPNTKGRGVGIIDDYLVFYDVTKEFHYYDAHSLAYVKSAENPYKDKIRSPLCFFDHNYGLWIEGENSISRLNIGETPFINVFDVDGLKYKRSNRGITQFKDEIHFVENSKLRKIVSGSNNYSEKHIDFAPILSYRLTGLKVWNDKIYAASERHGLLVFNDKSNKSKAYDFYDRKYRFIWQSHQDSQGQIWVGSEGLFKIDEEKELLVSSKEGSFNQLNKVVIHHFEDTEDGTWLCTSNGLYLVNLQEQTIKAHYNSQKEGDNYLPIEHCFHLFNDKDGVLWIATKGQGLVRWNKSANEFKSYTKENSGLSHDILYSVYPDDFGNLWMSSYRGLMRFNKTNETVSIFLEEQGLPNSEFNTISHFKDPDGRLYFGSVDGLISFDPKDFEIQKSDDENFFIRSAILRYRKTGKQHNIIKQLVDDQTIILDSEDSVADIELSVTNFESKNGIVYSYKFEEEEGWSFNSSGDIRIADLDYGNYKLLLKAKPLTSKKWIAYEHPIEVEVKKPYYLQWWFIALVALLLFSLIYIFFKAYTRQLRNKQANLERIVSERTEEIRFQAEGLKVQAEELKTQAEELKSLDKLKSNFFTNISHELKTPIALILGPLSYILDESNKLGEADIKKQLYVLERNAQKLNNLVQEILDLAKLDANKMEVDESVTNLDAFIYHVLTAFESQLNSLNIEFEFINQVDPSLNLLLDQKKVEKIISNFMSNAIKHAHKNGMIQVGIENLDGILKISVKDNGDGIHEEDLPYVFDRFFQSEMDENQLLGGTGIGLALVKELSALMNGQVEVESKLGVGSTFIFSLPIKEAHSIEPVPLQSVLEYIDSNNEKINVSNFSILIVEDNDDMRGFIKDLLSNLYKNLYTAANGEEALQILQEKEYNIDLVLSDVMMPKVNGLELFKKVRENKISSTIPFIMLTALSSERDKLASLLVGVDDYLTKPFSVPELLARVNNILVNYAQRKRWWSEEESRIPDLSQKAIPKNKSNEEEDAVTYDQQFVIDITKYIEDNLEKENLSVDLLAKKFFVSKRTLHRRLKALTGLTPSKLIKEVQLQKARRILEEDQNISIGDVAHKVGFYQRSTFALHFKKRYGVVPSKYKRE